MSIGQLQDRITEKNMLSSISFFLRQQLFKKKMEIIKLNYGLFFCIKFSPRLNALWAIPTTKPLFFLWPTPHKSSVHPQVWLPKASLNAVTVWAMTSLQWWWSQFSLIMHLKSVKDYNISLKTKIKQRFCGLHSGFFFLGLRRFSPVSSSTSKSTIWGKLGTLNCM